MKRTLTLLTFLTMCIASMQAGTITVGENQKWWGYMGDDTEDNSVGIGQSTDTYHCAMFLPGNHDVAGGKSICAVSFSLLAPHATNVKVWLATELPTSAPDGKNTKWVADVPDDQLGANIEVPLTQPYAITDEGVYVGYSFTITSASTQKDQYPVITSGTDKPNALLLRTDKYVPQWMDLYGNKFGVLNLRVLLEGTFAQYILSPSMKQDKYFVQVGETVDVDVILANNGEVAVNSFSYAIDNGEKQTVELGTALKPGGETRFTATIAADDVAGSSTKTLKVTQVNSYKNESRNASTTFTVNTVNQLVKRNVVVEELTGTGCGWCPRGLMGMEKLRNTFGDRFIGIGIHQYNNSDAMFIANYPDLNWQGAPSCRIDRGDIIDPYFGSSEDICEDFLAEMNQPAFVEVDVCGTMDEAMTEVAATAYVKSFSDTDDYTLELALVADGLSGTTSAWWQSNYYSSQPVSQVPEDLRIFCSGGKYGSNSIKGYVFNDVAIGSSFKNGVNQVEALGALTAEETREVSYTLAMPTKATLRTALKKSTASVYVVALVVDKSTGRIANAAKRLVGEEINAGVSTVKANTGITTNYSLNGTKLTAPQRGINIVRQADGTVRKVVIK